MQDCTSIVPRWGYEDVLNSHILKQLDFIELTLKEYYHFSVEKSKLIAYSVYVHYIADSYKQDLPNSYYIYSCLTKYSADLVLYPYCYTFESFSKKLEQLYKHLTNVVHAITSSMSTYISEHTQEISDLLRLIDNVEECRENFSKNKRGKKGKTIKNWQKDKFYQ